MLPLSIRVSNTSIEFNEFEKHFKNSVFSGVEINYSALENIFLKKLTATKKLKITNLIDLFPAKTLNSFTSCTEGFKKQLYESIYKKISETSEIPAKHITLDFDLPSHKKNSQENDEKIKLIKKLNVSLYHSNRILNIPLSIPSDEDHNNLTYMLSLMQEFMSSHIRVILNVYPHSFKEMSKIDEFLSKIRFDVDMIRLIYSPETGNYLSLVIIKLWFQKLLNCGFNGDIIFVPQTQNIALFFREVEFLSEVIYSIQYYINPS